MKPTRHHIPQFVILLLLMGGQTLVKGQSIRFSQFYAAPLFINPATTGISPDIQFNLNYRRQTLGNVKYETSQFGLIIPLKQGGQEDRHIGGVGINALSDMAGELGELRTYGGELSVAYRIPIDFYNKHILSLGLQGGFLQSTLDFGNLFWPSQLAYNGFDTSRPVNEPITDTYNVVVFNAGMLYVYDDGVKTKNRVRGNRFFVGAAGSYLNRPARSLINTGESNLPIYIRVHGGASFRVSKSVAISPSFLVASQTGLLQASIGSKLDYNLQFKQDSKNQVAGFQGYVGGWFRFEDAVVVAVGVGNDVFTAGFSYDFSISGERRTLPGQSAAEVALRYIIPSQKNINKSSTPLF